MNAGHDRRDPRGDSRRKRRQVNLVQRSLGHIGRGVFAAGGHGAIGAEMLGGCGDAIRGREVSSLEAPRLGRRHLGSDPGVLARTLDDASPARVARDVEHRRKSHGDPILCRLLGRDARRLLPEVRGEQAGFRQRNRENRVVAVDDVEAHEQRDAKAGFLHREALDGAGFVRAPEIEQIPDPPGSNPLVQIVKLAGAGDHAGRSDHVELPDLLLDRHCRQQLIDASHALALS